MSRSDQGAVCDSASGTIMFVKLIGRSSRYLTKIDLYNLVIDTYPAQNQTKNIVNKNICLKIYLYLILSQMYVQWLTVSKTANLRLKLQIDLFWPDRSFKPHQTNMFIVSDPKDPFSSPKQFSHADGWWLGIQMGLKHHQFCIQCQTIIVNLPALMNCIIGKTFHTHICNSSQLQMLL